MLYTMYYPSPLGRMLLAADGEGLVGAWFEGQKYYGSALEDDVLQEKMTFCAGQSSGWIFIFREQSRILRRPFI